ncbi:group II intron reverse transcriptase/maturase [Nocardia gipuzkoensis]|uniref:group II intron reverse transcriptase/maturase n=1 Tax=Nocardia gipuzkoensis TaxID=2749991 RepID=UPI00237DDE5A|nr:group II intron reverse transcriptase/maturase [Nocardia gipuzkoensis]MDE1675087.1 group II intron reverse transcriptase/maturase [Nocardia gipuzkoensis]
MPEEALVNTDAPPDRLRLVGRVREIQAKLHKWATVDPDRQFCDLFNLVADPAFLAAAWMRVRGNRGAKTAGVDSQTAYYIEQEIGVSQFLAEIGQDLKSGKFAPLPVRQRMIPKAAGKLRRLGIPTVRDRVVQAALKLVLEPIFEADFRPCSYGFRPKRRAQDAIAEIHLFTQPPRNYLWVLEADIEACFDNIDHAALMDRVRRRVGDKKVLALVKAFLKSGIMTDPETLTPNDTGTPQGGIISPLLANIALSVLDEHFQRRWAALGSDSQRSRARRRDVAVCRLVRYADDFVVLVHGTREQTRALRAEVSDVLAPLGLRLSEAKTSVVHLDEGFDFLGFRIQRFRKRGTLNKWVVYTYPSKKALASIIGKVRDSTRKNAARSLANLLRKLNPMIRGWCTYFRHAASSATFDYLTAFTWRRVWQWTRKRHPKTSARKLRRQFFPGWKPTDGDVQLFYAGQTVVSRYRYRGNIPSPWAELIAA